MRGIVHNGATVQYKFDTESPPALQAGEVIALRNDINSILTGAGYNPGTGEYTNPAPVPPPDWQALYSAAATDSEKLAVIAQKLGIV